MSESLAETTMQNVFILGEIMYLPSYQQPGRFVAPGADKHTTKTLAAHELRDAGATMTTHPLWSRAQ
jgi:hypothetical protein